MLIAAGALLLQLQMLSLLSGVLCMSEERRLCNDRRSVCYEISTLAVTHSRAVRFCNKRNGSLATIPDIETQAYISDLVKPEGNSHYWLNGKLDFMNQWTWLDGTRYPG